MLDDFVDQKLSPDSQMFADYNQLHYGARYRDVLVQMLRRRQEWEQERERHRADDHIAEVDARRKVSAEQSLIAKAAGMVEKTVRTYHRHRHRHTRSP